MVEQPTPAPAADVARQGRLDGIVGEAARLFTERGYERTSVNDLAAGLAMSVGGLYRYIETKSDLLVMVCEDIYGDLPGELAAIAAQPLEPGVRLVALVTRYLEACASTRPLILLMYREYRHLPAPAKARFQARENAIVSILADAIETGVRTSSFRPLAKPRTIAQDVVLLGHLPALKSWSLAEAADFSDLIAQQIRIVMAAIGHPPSRSS